MQWLCPLKYGIALLTAIEFDEDVVPATRTELVDQLIDRNGINRDLWYWYALMLVAVTVGFRTIATIALSSRAQSYA